MMSSLHKHAPSHRFERLLPLLLTLMLLLLVSACGSAEKAKSPADKPALKEQPQEAKLVALPYEPSTRAQVHANDARLGSDQARVTMIAFFDFECPYCASSYASLMKLRRQYTDEELRIVFKHLPLNFHQSALPAAIAGQAVQDLGGSEAFFTFASLAFENQKQLSFEQIAQWAESSGITRAQYNQSVQDKAVFQEVVEDVQQAQALGVRGTPAYYVNGKSLKGGQSEQSFRKLIDAELKLVTEGLSPEKWKVLYAERIEENLSSQLIDEILDDDDGRYQALVDKSPAEGAADALITLVMFTDFECPYCRKMEATLAALQVKYAGKLRLVFKHAPLPFHQQALPAHQIAQAIYEEKGSSTFFKASREIFLNSPHLEEAVLLKIAENHGLNENQARAALKAPSATVNERIKADADLARDLKANGTPHFFINGRRLAGARDRAYFEALIDHELLEAEQKIAQGLSTQEIYPTLMTNASLPGAPQKAPVELSIDSHPLYGSKDAQNIIHIFSDYECPYCRRGEQVIAQLKEKYGQDLAIVWHDLPLPFHQQAKPAARLARAVRNQVDDEAFWKAHAKIFNLAGNAPALTNEELVEIGIELGLSKVQAEHALSDESLDTVFREDQLLAEGLNISGTPAFVVNGYLVLGAQPMASFERVMK